MESYSSVRVLVITDLVGSTAMVSNLGDRRAAEVFAKVDDLSRGMLEAHRGREIDRTDGFLLLFEDALEATRYTLKLHRALETLSAEQDLPPLRVRAGIHVGSVILRENAPEQVAKGAKPLEVEGLTKPLTARIMASADGGQTLLSKAASDLVRRAAVGEPDTEGWTWVALGPRRFKGIADPVEVCEIRDASPPEPSDPPTPVSDRATRKWLRIALGVGAGVGVIAATIAAISWLAGGPTERIVQHADQDTRFGMPALSPLAELPQVMVPGVGYAKVQIDGDNLISSMPINHAGYRDHHTWESLLPPDFAMPLRIGTFDKAGNDGPYQQELNTSPWSDDSLGGPHEGQVQADHLIPRFNRFEVSQPGADLTVVTVFNLADQPIRHIRIERRDDGTTFVPQRGAVQAFDNQGRTVREWFEPLRPGVPAFPIHYRMEFEPNKRRRRSEDAAGNLNEERMVVIEELTFGGPDHPNHLASKRLFDRRNQPVAGPKGCADERWEYDEHSRTTANHCFGTQGEPWPFNDTHCASLHHQWEGNTSRTKCVDTEGKAAFSTGGWVVLQRDYDERGYLREMSLEDAEGRPIDGIRGYAKGVFRHDDNGLIVELGPYARADGTPFKRPDGAHILALTRDGAGRVTGVERRDREGEPAMGADGAVGWQFLFDDRNRLVEQISMDGEGHPAVAPTGTSRTQLTWSETGQLAKLEFLGVDRLPALHKTAGAATLRYERTPRGKVLARACFDLDDEPVLCPVAPHFQRHPTGSEPIEALPLCHRLLRTYDASEYAIGLACEDTEERPRATRYGWTAASWAPINLPAGTLRFLNSDGNLVDTAYGHAAVTQSWSERGRLLVESYTLADGSPGLSRFRRCAARQSRNDARNRLVEVRCSTGNGKPMRDAMGCATLRAVHNDETRVVERTCYDETDSPTPMIYPPPEGDGRPGATTERIHHDANWQILRIEALDGAGDPVTSARLGGAVLTTDRPEPGVRVETGLAADGTVLRRRAARRDPEGRLLQMTEYGPGLSPPTDAPPELTHTRDSRGRILETGTSTHGGDPFPWPVDTQVTRTVHQYDADGGQIEQFFDADDRPTTNRVGCYAMGTDHAPGTGLVRRRTCLDATRQPTDPATGSAHTVYRRDPYGRLVSVSMQDRHGMPQANPFAEVVATRSTLGALLSLRVLDAGGGPMASPVALGIEDVQFAPGDHAEIRWTRDAHDRIQRQVYTGPDGAPVAGPEGWQRWDILRDLNGRPVDERWFGADGKSVVGPEGCTQVERAYDSAGQVTETLCRR